MFSLERPLQRVSGCSAPGSAEREGAGHLRGVHWNLNGKGRRLALMGTLLPHLVTLVTAGFRGFGMPWVAVCTLVMLRHRG